jgi:sugar lactone lactonase YvrE
MLNSHLTCRYRSVVRLAGALMLCSLLYFAGPGCQHQKPPPQPNLSLVWPAPPDPARIAYVRSLSGPADLGIKQSGFARFGRWLTGSDKGVETFIKPFGINFDETDNLCLTDTGANAVCYYDRAKMKWRRWDKIGKLRFSSPVAVAKRNRCFYVADSALAAIVCFDEDGQLLRLITNHLARPSGLTIINDRLFVADSHRHCIVTFDLSGTFLSEFGTRGIKPGQFNFPTHLCSDPQGNLFVTDSMNSRVQVLDRQGAFKNQIGRIGDSSGQLSRPKGVAVDPLGHVYIIDALFDNVQVFDPNGALLLHLGAAGSAPGEFWLPNGIAVTRSNEIFIADSYNRRIQVFRYVGPS